MNDYRQKVVTRGQTCGLGKDAIGWPGETERRSIGKAVERELGRWQSGPRCTLDRVVVDIPRNRAVYRLLIGMSERRGDYRSLTIDTDDLTDVVRWKLSGSPDSYPNPINAEWVGDPSWRPVEFTPLDDAPIVGARIAEMFRADFEAAGTLQPLVIDGEERMEWFVFLAEKVVDCVDTDASSVPEWDGTIRKSVFCADAVPIHLPAFRVPQSTNVHWNGWMVDRSMKLVALDVEARLVWSEDPAREPHPDPWGF